MKQFVCRGTVKLRGATFYIIAEDLAEAQSKARHGDYEDVEYHAAELYDWECDTGTVESNE